MYKQLIKNYVNKLKKEDIIKYIENNNYKVSNEDIEAIYFYIKNYWEDFIDNRNDVWSRLENVVSPKTYKEILLLYNKYKKYL